MLTLRDLNENREEVIRKLARRNTADATYSLRAKHKVFGQLVRLGFDVTVFTPASYQRRSLRRPSMEL